MSFHGPLLAPSTLGWLSAHVPLSTSETPHRATGTSTTMKATRMVCGRGLNGHSSEGGAEGG